MHLKWTKTEKGYLFDMNILPWTEYFSVCIADMDLY